ncbi:MAG: aldo/keto reductase [Synergistaceae bacterium]|nr:aldo/keto reductase [Synergistaceae bacterium]
MKQRTRYATVRKTNGIGTYRSTTEQAHDAVLAALKAGYRHIDTAHAYQNERGRLTRAARLVLLSVNLESQEAKSGLRVNYGRQIIIQATLKNLSTRCLNVLILTI